MATSRSAEQRLNHRYGQAVGHCAANLINDIAGLQPDTVASPFARDKAIVTALAEHKQRTPRRQLLDLNLKQCSHKIANIIDHLRALQAVLGLDAPLMFAPTSTTRVIVEAAAGLNELLDASVDTDERILRAASELLYSFQQDVNVVCHRGLSPVPTNFVPGVSRMGDAFDPGSCDQGLGPRGSGAPSPPSSWISAVQKAAEQTSVASTRFETTLSGMGRLRWQRTVNATHQLPIDR
jgi:hypothetical protein